MSIINSIHHIFQCNILFHILEQSKYINTPVNVYKIISLVNAINEYIQSKLLQHTHVIGASSGQDKVFCRGGGGG